MERRAYICTHPDHGDKMGHYRLFILPDDPVPKCDKHEGRKMVRQPNRPYNVKHGGKRPI